MPPYPRMCPCLLFSGLVLACTPEEDPVDPPDTGRDTGDTGEPPPDWVALAPCGDGSWGLITDFESAFHVREDGSDDGDGSVYAPFRTPYAAVAAARAEGGGGHTLALGPGVFPANLALSGAAGDEGLGIQGCGRDETVLEAESDGLPVVLVSQATVGMKGMSTRGGQPGIQAWGVAQIALENMRIEDAYLVGVVVHGAGTRAQVADVEIQEIHTSWSEYAYGMTVQAEASATATDLRISGCTAAGLLVDAVTEFTLVGADITEISPDSSGYLGRGIQVQRSVLGEVWIQEARLDGASDAGIFAVATTSLVLQDNEVTGTLSALIPGVEEELSGDGIVVSRGPDPLAEEWFSVDLSGNQVSGSQRAGILLDSVSYRASGNSLTGNGLDAIAVQGEAVDLGGTDTVSSLVDPLHLNESLLVEVSFE